jgi:prepilin-type N-terminal cleavage/methylation domain-containing protein
LGGGERMNIKHLSTRREEGFTLIELLVVIGIIGILAAIVLIAVNPGRQFAQARDSQRRADLLGITNAIYQFAAEHNGNLPDTDPDPLVNSFPSSPTCIGSGATCFNLGAAGEIEAPVNQQELIVPTYIAAIPKDPSTGSNANTMYTVYKDANGRLVATATSELQQSDGTNIISVQR